MYGDPAFALFGSCNDRAIGAGATPSELIATAETVQYALNRASFGDRHMRGLRWIEIYDCATGDVVLSWDDRSGYPRPSVFATTSDHRVKST